MSPRTGIREAGVKNSERNAKPKRGEGGRLRSIRPSWWCPERLPIAGGPQLEGAGSVAGLSIWRGRGGGGCGESGLEGNGAAL